MLDISLIQFSMDVWGCVPSLLFTWRQTMVDVVKIMATSFKMSHACTALFSALTLQQATSYPRLHRRLLDTHGQAWISLLWGHCSFFWVLVYTMFCLYPPRVCFPLSCVSSGGSMVRLMLTSSKRVYAIRRSISSSVVRFSSCFQLFPA